MKTITIAFSAFVTAAVLAFGCSSSSSSSGSTCNAGSSATTSAACSSCMQSSCGSQLTQVASDCSAFVTCAEACGCATEACLSSCSAKLQVGSCQAAVSGQDACVMSSCASKCHATAVPDAGGTGGASTVLCSVVTQYDGAPPTTQCKISTLPPAESSAAPALMATCTEQGGTLVDACPTASLFGCCTAGGGGPSTETCYYGTRSDEQDAGPLVEQFMACAGTGGTWSAHQ